MFKSTFPQELLKIEVEKRVKDNFPLQPTTASLFSNDDVEASEGIHFFYEGESRLIPSAFIKRMEKEFKRKLGEFIPNNTECFIAGGSVLSYLLVHSHHFTKDFDIFVKSQDDYEKIKAHLIKAYKESGDSSRKCLESENSISFVGLGVDLIKQPFDSITSLLNKFDISVCKVGFSVNKEKEFKFTTGTGLSKLFNLKMFIDKNCFVKNKTSKSSAVQMLRRILKYSNKGFTLDSHSIIQFSSFFSVIMNDNPAPLSDSQFTKIIEAKEEEIGELLKVGEYKSLEYLINPVPPNQQQKTPVSIIDLS